jgi:hypothetical protein
VAMARRKKGAKNDPADHCAKMSQSSVSTTVSTAMLSSMAAPVG